jgi:diguanylate cyclase (GGDEF)-like protein
MLSGELTGRIYKLTRGKYLLGRSEDADIRLSDDGISRLHAELRRYDDELYLLKDLDSTNGTFVNGVQVRSQALNDGDRIQIGSQTVLKFSRQDSLEEQVQEKLYHYATRDSLTQAHNKRFFQEQLARDFGHAQRHAQPLSVLLLDLDHFKKVNDTHGHLVGDLVLSELGSRLIGSLRSEDVLCRIGGEEFAIIARDTPGSNAHKFALRLLRTVSDTPFCLAGTTLKVTVSIGTAEYVPGTHTAIEDLIAEADRRLYEAKAAGRNCVCPSCEEESIAPRARADG